MCEGPGPSDVPSGEPTLSVGGDRYTILLSSARTGGRTAVIEAFVPPGGGPPMHVHRREDEFFYVLEGAIDFTANGRTERINAGGCFFAPLGAAHRFRNATARPARMLVWVTPGGLDEYFTEVGTRLPSRASPPVAPTDADLARLVGLAPKYGLEIVAPDPR